MSIEVENVVMHGPQVGKLGKEQKLKSIVMDGVKKGRGDMVKSVVMDGVKNWKFWKNIFLKKKRRTDESK